VIKISTCTKSSSWSWNYHQTDGCE